MTAMDRFLQRRRTSALCVTGCVRCSMAVRRAAEALRHRSAMLLLLGSAARPRQKQTSKVSTSFLQLDD